MEDLAGDPVAGTPILQAIGLGHFHHTSVTLFSAGLNPGPRARGPRVLSGASRKVNLTST
ncbi:hypothetical protein GCM10027456_52890 [Kineosporia babensis]